MLLTAHKTLAREVAGLFWSDKFKLGAHRLHWYLSHSWTSRFVPRVPRFDPTTNMDMMTIDVLSDWLGDDTPRERLAHLYILARKINEASDQQALLDAYEKVATTLVPDLESCPHSGSKPAEAPRFSLEDGRSALTALRALTDRWYIISGTFLGAVREGTFLSHDYDIDIGIHAEEFDEATFLDTVSRSGDLVFVNISWHSQLMGLDGVWRSVPKPALYRLLHRSGIGIDVFIHYKDGNLRWHGSDKHRWDNEEFDLAQVKIAGIGVLGPADADHYLTENYGDWRTPVTEFNCTTGTPNVSIPRNLTAISEFMRIAILNAGTADAEVARAVLVQEGYVREGCFMLPWR